MVVVDVVVIVFLADEVMAYHMHLIVVLVHVLRVVLRKDVVVVAEEVADHIHGVVVLHVVRVLFADVIATIQKFRNSGIQ